MYLIYATTIWPYKYINVNKCTWYMIYFSKKTKIPVMFWEHLVHSWVFICFLMKAQKLLRHYHHVIENTNTTLRIHTHTYSVLYLSTTIVSKYILIACTVCNGLFECLFVYILQCKSSGIWNSHTRHITKRWISTAPIWPLQS